MVGDGATAAALRGGDTAAGPSSHSRRDQSGQNVGSEKPEGQQDNL